MRRLGWMMVLLALGMGMCVELIDDDPAAPPNVAADSPGEFAPAAAASAPASSPRREPEVSAVPGATAELGATIVGRCVGADGVALSEARVTVTGSRFGPVSATTGADGRFTLQVWPVAQVPLRLIASHPTHLEADRQWSAPAVDEQLDAGELRLAPGVVVAGVAREADGTPARELTMRAVPIGEWPSEPRHASARTDGDGAFTFDAALAPGRWLVRADPREFVAPVMFTVAPGATQPLDLTLAPAREPRRIRGIVVDARGETICGVTVAALSPAGVQPCVSGVDGGFELIDWSEQGDAAMLVLQPTDGGTPDPATRVAWGSADIRLEWCRGTTLRVQVRWLDVARDPGCHVALWCDDGAPRPGTPSRLVRSDVHTPRAIDPHDEVEVPHLLPGRYLVYVIPPVAGQAAAKPCSVEVGGSPRVAVTLEVVGLEERELLVQWADGSPAAGCLVSWAATSATGHGETDGAWQLRPPELQTCRRFANAQGTVRLRAPRTVAGRLEIATPRGPSVVRDGVALHAQPDPWIETLPAGGSIEVAGLDDADSTSDTTIELARADGARWPRRSRREILLGGAVAEGPEAGLRFVGVPPGTWRIERVARGRREVLGEVRDLVAGELRRVELRRPERAMATVNGTVRWNGRPHALGVVLLRTTDADGAPVARGAPRSAEALESPGGRLRGSVPADVYHAYLAHPLTQHLLPIPGEVDLRDGGAAPLDLHLRTRPVRLRVVRNGLPWHGLAVRITLATGETLEVTTDVRGVAEVALPLGVHTCSTHDAGAPLGPIDVPAGEGPVLATLAR